MSDLTEIAPAYRPAFAADQAPTVRARAPLERLASLSFVPPADVLSIVRGRPIERDERRAPDSGFPAARDLGGIADSIDALRSLSAPNLGALDRTLRDAEAAARGLNRYRASCVSVSVRQSAQRLYRAVAGLYPALRIVEEREFEKALNLGESVEYARGDAGTICQLIQRTLVVTRWLEPVIVNA